MNLIQHHELRPFNCRSNLNKTYNRFLNIYEVPPQKRTLFDFNENKFKSIDFPYLYFILLYFQDPKTGKYIYGGQPCASLRIFCKETPLTEEDQKVYSLTFESGTVICTDHEYDNKRFDSVDEMISFLAAEWYSLEQYIEDNFDPNKKYDPIKYSNQFELDFFMLYCYSVGFKPKLKELYLKSDRVTKFCNSTNKIKIQQLAAEAFDKQETIEEVMRSLHAGTRYEDYLDQNSHSIFYKGQDNEND